MAANDSLFVTMDTINQTPYTHEEIAQTRDFFFNIVPCSTTATHFDFMWSFVDNVYSLVHKNEIPGQRLIQYFDCRRHRGQKPYPKIPGIKSRVKVSKIPAGHVMSASESPDSPTQTT